MKLLLLDHRLDFDVVDAVDEDRVRLISILQIFDGLTAVCSLESDAKLQAEEIEDTITLDD